MAFCSHKGCKSDMSLWQVIPLSLQPKLRDWEDCTRKLCRVVVHNVEEAASAEFDMLSDAWDTADMVSLEKDCAVSRRSFDNTPSSIHVELNEALQTFCSACFHNNSTLRQLVDSSGQSAEDNAEPAGMTGLTVSKIACFADDLLSNVLSDALQEAAYMMVETRCRRRRLEQQRQLNLRRAHEQSKLSVGGAGGRLRHANSLGGGGARQSASFSTGSSSSQRRAPSRTNRSMPDIRRDSMRRSSLQYVPRVSSSSSVHGRRLERFQRCDARQFSETEEDGQRAAPHNFKSSKVCAAAKRSVINEECMGNCEQQDDEHADLATVTPTVSEKENEKTRNSRCRAVDEEKIEAKLHSHQCEESKCNRNCHSELSVQDARTNGRHHAALVDRHPSAHLLNNLCEQPAKQPCTGNGVSCCSISSCSSATVSSCRVPSASNVISSVSSCTTCSSCSNVSRPACQCMSVGSIGTTSGEIDELSPASLDYLGQLSAGIINSAVKKSSKLMLRGNTGEVCSSEDNQVGVYSRPVKDLIEEWVDASMISAMVPAAMAEAVDVICRNNFLHLPDDDSVSSAVMAERMQQLADDFVCHVMQDAVNVMAAEEHAHQRLRTQLSLDEIREGWVRPLDNMQHSLTFFDVEFGGTSPQMALTPRTSVSATTIDSRRRSSTDDWHRHRRSSSSSGSSGSSSRRSTMLLDFEDELKRNGSVVGISSDFDVFRRYLAQRAGEDYESKPVAEETRGLGSADTLSSNLGTLPLKADDGILKISDCEPPTANLSDKEIKSGDGGKSVKDARTKGGVKSSVHWVAWHLVMNAFHCALPVVASLLRSCEEEDQVKNSVVYAKSLSLGGVEQDKTASCDVNGVDEKLARAAERLGEVMSESILSECVTDVWRLSCQYDCAQRRLLAASCAMPLERLEDLASDIACHIVREAEWMAAAAIDNCLFVQSRPIIVHVDLASPQRTQMHLLVQWAAASFAGCPQLHFLVTDPRELIDLERVCAAVRSRERCVGGLIAYLLHYSHLLTSARTTLPLFSFILQNDRMSTLTGV